MRIPWIATLDALIDELNRHLTEPYAADELRDGLPPEPQRPWGAEPEPPPVPTAKEGLRGVIRQLVALRSELALVLLRLPFPGKSRLEAWELGSELDVLDERKARYPDYEGREGLARYIEQGGLFGPILGRHIADAIRGKALFKPGPAKDFEEARERRFTVRRIATIRHLYAVGLAKAVEFFCAHHHPDDPEQTAPARVTKWVKLDQKAAKKALQASDLSEREQSFWRAVLEGVRPEQPRGVLKGMLYPEAFEELKKSASG